MLFEKLWFMGLEPEELWRGEAGHGGHPGKLPDIGKFPVEGSGFRPGASVIPKNGWTKNLARRIQNHGPVHLSGKPNGRNAQPVLAVPGTQQFAGLLQGQPPVLWILFRPAGLRPCDRQWDFGKPHNTLFMVGDYAFERRRPEIDAKIGGGAESHGY